MTTQQTIEKAIEGGYMWHGSSEFKFEHDKIFVFATDRHGVEIVDVEQLLLDPTFWQCLGKAMGWDGWHYFYRKTVKMETWRWHWHRLIDHLAEGKDITSFFEQL